MVERVFEFLFVIALLAPAAAVLTGLLVVGVTSRRQPRVRAASNETQAAARA